jgi:hypothetical protein
MTPSLRVLLGGLIDYAGLFPPAALGMAETVGRYASYRDGLHASTLGRLVVPASRLDEFERTLSDALATSPQAEPWQVSLLAAPPYDDVVARIWEFNGKHGACGTRQAVVDSVEVTVSTAAEVERAADAFPAGFALFVETPTVNAPAGLLDAVAKCRAGAKLRTGGTSAEKIPSTLGLATALMACHETGLSFKATAGLHHALRSERRLTYDPAPPRAVVHGFLNVLVASAVITAGWVDTAGAAEILAEESADAFRVGDDAIAWRGHRLALGDLRAARRFFRSFGSCSFDEPVADLENLGLL